MAWCRSATSHYLIEWWPSSLTHISIASNKRIVIYGECYYAMQRHRFTMTYQKARCNTQHQPPPYASTGTQRGYADFRRHLPSSLVIRWLASKLFMCCLLYTRDWIDLNKGFNYSDTTWAPWRFRTKTTPNKRPKFCIINPLWGGGGLQSSVGYPQKGPLMRKTFPCYAGESVWNQGRISNTMNRNLCWIP